jgi:hypothetical protein
MCVIVYEQPPSGLLPPGKRETRARAYRVLYRATLVALRFDLTQTDWEGKGLFLGVRRWWLRGAKAGAHSKYTVYTR